AIDLGPSFRTTQTARFTLTVTRQRAALELQSSSQPAMVALAGSANMKLTGLRIDTGGTFEGGVTGELQVFGKRLAQATFDVRLESGLFEIQLPSNRAASVDWGFGSVDVHGHARSNGTFEFKGSIGSTGAFGGVSWAGAAAITAIPSGLSGTFSGRVCLAGLACADATGNVDASGRVTGNVRLVVQNCLDLFDCGETVLTRSFTFNIGSNSLGPDTTRPTMAQPDDVTVVTTSTDATIAVHFEYPVAQDDRSGAIVSTCTPA